MIKQAGRRIAGISVVMTAVGAVWLGGVAQTAVAQGEEATGAVAACRAQGEGTGSLHATVAHVVRARKDRRRRDDRAKRNASHRGRKVRLSAAEAELQGEANSTVGPYTAVLLSNTSGNLNAVCIVESGTQVVGNGGGSGGASEVLSADQIEEPAWGYTLANGKMPLLYSYARVGADVTGLSIVFSNEARVLASVEHGWFLAMWAGLPAITDVPGAEPVESLEVTTTHGTTDRPLNISAEDRLYT